MLREQCPFDVANLVGRAIELRAALKELAAPKLHPLLTVKVAAEDDPITSLDAIEYEFDALHSTLLTQDEDDRTQLLLTLEL